MVIRRMNNMFTRHGRWMFAIITLFIIVSFVGFLTPGFNSMFSFGGGSGSAGTAFGKKISAEQVREQAIRDSVALALAYGVDPSNSQVFEMAEKNAFYSICALYAAAQCGVWVSDQEIAAYLEKLPRFQGADQQFDINKYNDFVKNSLKPHGITESTLEQGIRESLMKQQLSEQITGDVIATPDEIRAFFNVIREKFEISVAEFKASTYAAKEKVTDEDVKNYFEANRKKYIMPERYNIRTVEFDYSGFAAKAGAGVTEQDIQKYYESHKNEFTKMEKGKPVTTPLSKVKNEIKTNIINERAAAMAMEMAQQFAVDAYNETQGKDDALVRFQGMIKANGFKENVYGWIDKKTVALGKRPVEPELMSEIDAIYIKSPVSNPVAGRDCAYVVFLEAREDAKPATFEEVKSQVTQDLQLVKGAQKARDQARHAAGEIVRLKNNIKVFRKMAPQAVDLDAFDAMNPPYSLIGGILATLAENTPAGAISEVKDTPEGAVFVYVRSRALPNDKDYEQVKSFINSFYIKMKQDSASNNFNLWLQSKCKIYELRRD